VIMLRRAISRLLFAEDGVAAIEFCIAMPVLLMMTLGVHDVSRMIAARVDYQQAVTETVGLALARPPQDGESLDYLRNAAAAAAGVPANDVSVVRQVRCNNVVTQNSACPQQDQFALYVSVTINGGFTPTWTHFGVDRPVSMTVSRTLRIR